MKILKMIRRTRYDIEILYDKLNDLQNREQWVDSFFIPNEHVLERKWNSLMEQENCIKEKIKLLEEKISSLEQQNEATQDE